MKKFDYEIEFNAKNYESYKDLYRDIAKKLEADKVGDCWEPEDFGFRADHLCEYLGDYKYNDLTIHVTFIGFDRKKLNLKKTYNDSEISLILSCFEELAETDPRQVVEFKDVE